MAQDDYEVIIIGAGLGGLSCAALLAKAGRRVLVLERNRQLGGRFGSLKRGGFTVDWGTHMITRYDGPYRKVLQRLGLDGEIRFLPLERDNPPMIEFAGARFPLPFPQWTIPPLAMAMVPLRWRFTVRETVGAGLAMSRIVLAMKHTADHLENRTFGDWLERYMPPGRALELVGSLPMPLFGVPYWEFSAGEAIRNVQDWWWDVSSCYPEGGTGAIAAGLAAAVKEHGGDVAKRCEVESVTSYAGRVTGVRMSDGERLRAPVVISNLGVKDTVRSLVGPRRLPADYRQRVARYRETSMSTVQVKFAIEGWCTDAPCIMGSPDAGLDLEEFYRDVQRGEVPGSFMGVVSIPSNIDPELAPEGHQLVLGMMLSPLEADDWTPWIELCRRGVEEMVPGVAENTVWSSSVTPDDVAAVSGRSTNASLGLAQVPGQVGAARPDVALPIEGLYCVGDDTGREGICSELALESAMACADRILRPRKA